MNCYITFEYLASLKRQQLILAEYNTNIIHRLYQTIEKRDRCPPSVYLKVPYYCDSGGYGIYTTSMTKVVVNIVVSISTNY